MPKKKQRWVFLVKCPCNNVIIVGRAPSPAESPDWAARPQAILCNKCNQRTAFAAQDFWRIPMDLD
jgi:hypothetical protein